MSIRNSANIKINFIEPVKRLRWQQRFVMKILRLTRTLRTWKKIVVKVKLSNYYHKNVEHLTFSQRCELRPKL